MPEVRHKILHREIDARPLLREALTQDPALAHHVAALDQFLVALAMDLPDGWLAERVIGRCLPSNQTILEEKQRREEMLRVVTEYSTEGLALPPEVISWPGA